MLSIFLILPPPAASRRGIMPGMVSIASPNTASDKPLPQAHTPMPAEARRSLLAASVAHAVHDGMTDLIYVLLPLWQSQFGLSLAFTGALRGLYAACMAGFQVPATRLARRWGRPALLVGGTVLVALAYLVAGLSGALPVVCGALLLGGLGASTQHPLASALVADAYAGHRVQARRALASYNFAGDLGKTAVPAGVGALLMWLSWQHSLIAVGLLGLGAAAGLAWLLRAPPLQGAAADGGPAQPAPPQAPVQPPTWGFTALAATGVVDSGTRMGFLTFLPFVLSAKGAGAAGTGLALGLLFVGGALGKLLCAVLERHLGLLRTVWLTEGATALCIVGTLLLPWWGALALMPLLGLMLNGTSSVLYGCVPDLVPPERRDRAFALYYTATIGAGAIAPSLFGWLGDQWGVAQAMQAVAAFVLLTLPLTWVVRQALAGQGRD